MKLVIMNSEEYAKEQRDMIFEQALGLVSKNMISWEEFVQAITDVFNETNQELAA